MTRAAVRNGQLWAILHRSCVGWSQELASIVALSDSGAPAEGAAGTPRRHLSTLNRAGHASELQHDCQAALRQYHKWHRHPVNTSLSWSFRSDGTANLPPTVAVLRRSVASERAGPEGPAEPPTRPETAPQATHWIERVSPESLLPFVHLARLHKPIGTWLLAWPGFWSIGMSTPVHDLPNMKLLVLFGAGSVLLRGAGCTINDMLDRDLDSKVARTRYRPLASGLLTYPAAWAFLAAQLSLGLVILLQLNFYSQVLGASSLLLVATYPLMKRVTHVPQLYLGLTINWGAMLGWAAACGSCNWPVVLPLYLSGVAWTLVYDTIYAHMDKVDDRKIGVKSTALLLQDRTKPVLYGLAAVMGGLQSASGAMLGVGLPFYLGVSCATAHALWQIADVDLDKPDTCLDKFKSNFWLGAILMSGILVDRCLW